MEALRGQLGVGRVKYGPDFTQLDLTIFLPNSTNGDERCLVAFFIAGNAGGLRIKHWIANNNEPILVMAMSQLQFGQPPAIQRASHGQRMPVAEVARQLNQLRVWRGGKMRSAPAFASG